MRLSRNIAIIVAVGLLLVFLVAGVAFAYVPEYGNGWCWDRTNWGWSPPAINTPDGVSPTTTVPGGSGNSYSAPGCCW